MEEIKKEVVEEEVVVDEEVTTEEEPVEYKKKTLITMANDILPDIMELREVNDSITLYLLIRSDIKSAGGNYTSMWKPIHKMCEIVDAEVFLNGYIKALETISNFERLMQLETEAEQEEDEKDGLII